MEKKVITKEFKKTINVSQKKRFSFQGQYEIYFYLKSDKT